MFISGLTGFAFFLIANFGHVFHGMDVLAGCIQISINTFVFLTWKRGFMQSTGFAKAFALIGTVVPIIMASITLVRVISPAFLNLLTHLAK